MLDWMLFFGSANLIQTPISTLKKGKKTKRKKKLKKKLSNGKLKEGETMMMMT